VEQFLEAIRMKLRYILAALLIVTIAVGTTARERPGSRSQCGARSVWRKVPKADRRWALDPANVPIVFPDMNAKQKKMLRIQTKALQILMRDYAGGE